MSADDFHALAKDAGNRLKGYILAYASGATGVFFLSLSSGGPTRFTAFEKTCLVAALAFFVATVAISLFELHIDARRFFNVAKQLERQEGEPSWTVNERYKLLRVRLIYLSYVTAAVATGAAVAFLVSRIA